jgi:transposase
MEQVSVNRLECCIGLDLGDRTTAYCSLGAQGQFLAQGAIETTHEGVERLLSSLPPTRVVMEATRNTHWVRKVVKSFGHEVIVANPRRLDLITKSLRKTDRNDAQLLARLGQTGLELLAPVHERSDRSMQVRALLRARALLVRTRTRIVNQVRGSVRIFGSSAPTCDPCNFHIKARAAIPPILQSALLPLLDMLKELKRAIAVYDREILDACKTCPQTTLFQGIHGVGPLVALTFVMCIEDPRRFRDSRSVGAYLGLVPGSRQSGAKDPKLRITKQGEGELRSLLVTAATHVLRRSAPDCELKRYGRRIAASGTPRDKGRARVAVARKLACLMHRLWRTGEVYLPLRDTQAA